MARLDDIDIDIRNAVLRANATDREEIARILRYLYRLSEKLKWWQTKLDRGNLTEEERKAYEGLITGAEEIRQELAGKVNDDQMADAMHNGLLSMLDWPKLQFFAIPKNIDLDTYGLGMGMYWASDFIASTLTHYPTSRNSILVCFGEPDTQYQLVIEVDRNAPKIYGRPVYLSDPWPWKELHWFDTATASSDGLMSAADKARLDEIEVGGRNLLLNSADPVIHASGSATYTVTKNQSVSAWNANNAIKVAGTGGTSANVFYVGGVSADIAYNSSISLNGQKYSFGVYVKNNHAANNVSVRVSPTGNPQDVTLAPGESKFVSNHATGNGSSVLQIVFRTPSAGDAFDVTFWHPKIEEGTFATDWTPAVEDYAGETSVTFSSIRNTTNTSAASGTLRRVGKTVNLIFSATLANALAASTWLTIGTLPSGYLPTENIYTSAVWIGGTEAQVYIGTGSAIQVWSSQAQGAGAVVRGSVTWFAA